MKTSNEKMRDTVYAVGIGAELVARVVVEISGNDISNTLGATPITLQTVGQIAAARIQSKLNVA